MAESERELDFVVGEVISGLEDADCVPPLGDPGPKELRRGKTLFGVIDGRAIDLRLGPDIADAATRTPDTTESARGPDWVRFAPQHLDQHDLDRLRAWLTTAWRIAERAN